MDLTALRARMSVRLGTESAQDDELNEILTTIADRICLRAGVAALPDALCSICVDAGVKLWRRRCFEGVASDGAGELTTAFADDALAEYEPDLARWRAANSARNVVRLI